MAVEAAVGGGGKAGAVVTEAAMAAEARLPVAPAAPAAAAAVAAEAEVDAAVLLGGYVYGATTGSGKFCTRPQMRLTLFLPVGIAFGIEDWFRPAQPGPFFLNLIRSFISSPVRPTPVSILVLIASTFNFNSQSSRFF